MKDHLTNARLTNSQLKDKILKNEVEVQDLPETVSDLNLRFVFALIYIDVLIKKIEEITDSEDLVCSDEENKRHIKLSDIKKFLN